jgi:hypothetical protein
MGAEHWPHTRRNKRSMLPPPPPSSSHERGEAVCLTLLFHSSQVLSDASPRNSIPSTDQRKRRRRDWPPLEASDDEDSTGLWSSRSHGQLRRME